MLKSNLSARLVSAEGKGSNIIICSLSYLYFLTGRTKALNFGGVGGRAPHLKYIKSVFKLNNKL